MQCGTEDLVNCGRSISCATAAKLRELSRSALLFYNLPPPENFFRLKILKALTSSIDSFAAIAILRSFFLVNRTRFYSAAAARHWPDDPRLIGIETGAPC